MPYTDKQKRAIFAKYPKEKAKSIVNKHKNRKLKKKK